MAQQSLQRKNLDQGHIRYLYAKIVSQERAKHQSSSETSLLEKRIIGFVPLNWVEFHFQYIRIK